MVAVGAQNYVAVAAADRAARKNSAAAENLAVEQSFVAAEAALHFVADNSVAVWHSPVA